jgi:hypothetical protein
MARTVEKILKEDDDKLDVGADGATLVDTTVDDGVKTPTPEETVAEMKKQIDAANARADREAAARKEAEEQAAKASNANATAVKSQITAQEEAIAGKINAAKTSLDSIKQQLKQAKSAGDGDAEVELQDALTDARYKLNAAEWEKGNFDRWKEAQTKAPATTEVKSPYTAKEQAWIDSHPEFGTNKKFARVAKLAAQEALDEGHKQDSAGYFKYIEDTLKENNLLGTPEEPLSDANTSVSTAAAPNRTGTGDAPPVGKNAKYPFIPSNFRIPADWVEAAKDQGFDDVREYANMRLEEEGKGSQR